MRDCFILGSGRSGTSMVAGLFDGHGYFLGHNADYIRPRRSNPKGFFEDQEVNWLNELLLERWATGRQMAYGTRWLAAIPDGEMPDAEPSASISERIVYLTSQRPFCFKDPRFCYTLATWSAAAPRAAAVCVFRHPGRTAASIVTECRSAAYLAGVPMSMAAALRVWRAMYTRALQLRERVPGMLFVHYEQILDGSGVEKLEVALDASLERSFPDRNLFRSSSSQPCPADVLALYDELCRLANFAA